MEISINSSCCIEAPTMSAKEIKPRNRRIAEESRDKKTMGVGDGMMKPQLPFSQLSSLAEHKKEIGAASADATMNMETLMQSIFPPHDYIPVATRPHSVQHNENAFGSLEGRTQALNQVMEALADPTIHIMGLHSSNENAIKIAAATLPEKVIRRVKRDNIFDVILKANVTNKPNIKKIQDEIAGGLSLMLDKKSKSKRASILHDSIKMRQKVLIIFCELYKGIDLRKVGIPYGADHNG